MGLFCLYFCWLVLFVFGNLSVLGVKSFKEQKVQCLANSISFGDLKFLTDVV